MHSGFAKLHADGLFRLCGLNSQTNYTNIEAVSLTAAARISAFSQLSPRVKLGKSAATLHQPTNTGSEAPKSSFLCNWRVHSESCSIVRRGAAVVARVRAGARSQVDRGGREVPWTPKLH